MKTAVSLKVPVVYITLSFFQLHEPSSASPVTPFTLPPDKLTVDNKRPRRTLPESVGLVSRTGTACFTVMVMVADVSLYMSSAAFLTVITDVYKRQVKRIDFLSPF